MENKLVWRAAAKYLSWMISQEHAPNNHVKSMVRDRVYRASHKVSVMRDYIDKFFEGSRQRIQHSRYDNRGTRERYVGIPNPNLHRQAATNMLDDLGKDAIVEINNVLGMLEKIIGGEIIVEPSIREITEEINIVASSWEEVEFKNNELSVLIKDVVLSDDEEEVPLGSFWIRIDLSDPIIGIKITSVDEIKSYKKLHSHPHVKGEELCIGDGSVPVKEALCQGRLEDCFRIIEAVLRTYNPSSPYEPLAEWYNPNHDHEFFCETCYEWELHENGEHCEECGTTHCRNCDNGGGCCKECGRWICEDCNIVCKDCGQIVCGECSVECDDCKNNFCCSCTIECKMCSKILCGSCMSTCSCCDNSICDECVKECGCCKENCCESCLDEKCNNCEENICGGCNSSCSECEELICNSCAENSCDHCGVPMCGSCEEKHSCLLEGISSE